MADYFYVVIDGIVEVAQEKEDFIYYDNEKKKKFMDQQYAEYQRRLDFEGLIASRERRERAVTASIKRFQRMVSKG